jgi:hypothetical protein
MPLLFQPSPPPCIKCGTTTVVAPAFEDSIKAPYASGKPDHGTASVGTESRLEPLPTTYRQAN